MKGLHIFFIILGILTISTIFFYQKNTLSASVTFGETKFIVETAVTSKEKEVGLGYRKNLKPLHGMLFLYDHTAQYPFWMKAMEFPLDFVWMDGNVVMDITENVSPKQTVPLPVITPKVPVDKILELNAGDVAKYGIKIGDRAVFNK